MKGLMTAPDEDGPDYSAFPQPHGEVVPAQQTPNACVRRPLLGIAVASAFAALSYQACSALMQLIQHATESSTEKGPPHLCYEFVARVQRRKRLKEDAHTISDESSSYVLNVSRASSTLEVLQAPSDPFRKEFRSFWGADSRPANHSGRWPACVERLQYPFFDEVLCFVLPAHGGHSAEGPDLPCILHAIRQHMPLDRSFAGGSTAYVHARVAPRRSQHSSLPANVGHWAYAPKPLFVPIVQYGEAFVAQVRGYFSFDVAVDEPSTRAPCEGSGDGRLLASRSELTISIDAAGGRPRTISSVTQMDFEYLGAVVARSREDTGATWSPSPPPMESCVDVRPAGAAQPTRARTFEEFGGPGTSSPLDMSPPHEMPFADEEIDPLWLVGRVNEPSLIRAINAQQGLGWSAGVSPYLDGASFLTVRRALGTRFSAPPSVDSQSAAPGLPPSPHAAQLLLRAQPLPESFDARTAWPQCSALIGRVPNQGRCGSCWAIGAVGVLADRICIGTSGRRATPLSAESLLRCDSTDAGCDGGFTDNAWRFLVMHGATADECQTYSYCPDPAMPNCSVGYAGTHPSHGGSPSVWLPAPSPPPASPSAQNCSMCDDGTHAEPSRAETAYAVGHVGDAEAMRRELVAHGPIETSFFVYSDFVHYRRGVYRRSDAARGPLGGHAVKLIGYGVERGAGGDKIPYWLAQNSWSAEWGDGGFFRILRGRNECGIETMPAAGLPRL